MTKTHPRNTIIALPRGITITIRLDRDKVLNCVTCLDWRVSENIFFFCCRFFACSLTGMLCTRICARQFNWRICSVMSQVYRKIVFRWYAAACRLHVWVSTINFKSISDSIVSFFCFIKRDCGRSLTALGRTHAESEDKSLYKARDRVIDEARLFVQEIFNLIYDGIKEQYFNMFIAWRGGYLLFQSCLVSGIRIWLREK